MGGNMKDRMVLDYDICQLQKTLTDKLRIPLRWENVDSRIEQNIYKDGQKPKGGEFSIMLNIVMDQWAEMARDEVTGAVISITNPQVWYQESKVMVQLKDGDMIYGDIEKRTTHQITKDALVDYLMSKNKHWTQEIFATVEWEAMGSALEK